MRTLLQIFKSFVSENKLLVSGYALIFLAYPLEEVVFPEYYGRIIETLTKIYEGDGGSVENSTASSGTGNIAGMMKQADSTLSFG